MLDPHDRWIWDFWHAHHEGTHHLYYVQAPRSLGDPELRHRNATIAHATSPDLLNWTEHGTVLTPGPAGAVDETATWTGSVVRGDDGRWRMFYTGSHFLDPATTTNIEGIAVATSDDLWTWQKDASLRLHADPTWYETLGDSDWPEEAWRDPWVTTSAGGGWDMLITARARTGPLADRGVVGYAHSDDLLHWTTRPPLTDGVHGFAQLEVLQTVTVEGRRFVLFSCHEQTMSAARITAGGGTGVWAAPAQNGIDLQRAHRLTGDDLYSGRIVEHGGRPFLLAFRTEADDGSFRGGITDPIPVTVQDDQLALTNTAREDTLAGAARATRS